MRDWKLPWDGGCRCGQVRIRVSAPPLLAAACHCNGCQRMTASAYSLTLIVPSEGFAVIAGEPVIGGLHGPTRHFFCPHCKSWVFTRPEGFDQFVNLRATMLDEHGWFAPFVEVWTEYRLPFAATGAPHSFATQPATAEEYFALADAYAREGAGPG